MSERIESIAQVLEAVREAEREIYRAEKVIRQMAIFCAGRLQSSGIDNQTLVRLKKELARYNMHTGKWSD